jgi:hypothetical protein
MSNINATTLSANLNGLGLGTMLPGIDVARVDVASSCAGFPHAHPRFTGATPFEPGTEPAAVKRTAPYLGLPAQASTSRSWRDPMAQAQATTLAPAQRPRAGRPAQAEVPGHAVAAPGGRGGWSRAGAL